MENKTGNHKAKKNSFACIIEGEDIPLEEMIQNIQKGIFVGRFSGGAPGAKIYNLDDNPVKIERWTELENVRTYYDFFKNHETEF